MGPCIAKENKSRTEGKNKTSLLANVSTEKRQESFIRRSNINPLPNQLTLPQPNLSNLSSCGRENSGRQKQNRKNNQSSISQSEKTIPYHSNEGELQEQHIVPFQDSEADNISVEAEPNNQISKSIIYRSSISGEKENIKSLEPSQPRKNSHIVHPQNNIKETAAATMIKRSSTPPITNYCPSAIKSSYAISSKK